MHGETTFVNPEGRREFRTIRSRALAALGVAAVLVVMTGCGAAPSSSAPASAAARATASPSTTPRTDTVPTTGAPTEIETPSATEGVTGRVVRFSANGTTVDVTIGPDSPATRDFLSMLPLTLTLEELGGREKISYLPRELNYAGSPGSDPENGDLIYFIPWGNLGFYYNAAGIEYSDQTLHIGTYDATVEQLDLLEGDDVIVEQVH
jgi:hypothetical protein